MLRTSAGIRTSAVLLCVAGLATATAVHAGPLPRIPSGGWEPNWTLGGNPVRLIEVPAAAPVGIGACPGVRPGAIVNSDVGQCTFNFLFEDDDGFEYIGTAGHCILGTSPPPDSRERTWGPGDGPVARNAAGARIGEFAYAILQDPKDFALIALDDGVATTPQMCHFGGPTGVNEDTPPPLVNPVVLHYNGNGLVLGSALPARSCLAFGMPDRNHVFCDGLATPGDSGSGVISADGLAVGVLVTLGVHLSDGLHLGTIGITRLAPQVERAEEVLGIDLTLQTADLL
jgi:hypothetical protein